MRLGKVNSKTPRPKPSSPMFLLSPIYPGLLIFCVSKHMLCSHLPPGFCICCSFYLAHSLPHHLNSCASRDSSGSPSPTSRGTWHLLWIPTARFSIITAFVMFVCPTTLEPETWGLSILSVYDYPLMKEWRDCVLHKDGDPPLPGSGLSSRKRPPISRPPPSAPRARMAPDR